MAIISAWFAWLAKAGYLARNPWVLINRDLGDDAQHPDPNDDPTTRAFTPAAWTALLAQLDDFEAGNPQAAARLPWVVAFTSATGRRASEMILARSGAARRSARRQTSEVWMLAVLGKGRKLRQVVVPNLALQVTREYLTSRGLDFDGCPADRPLLGSLAPGCNAIDRSDEAMEGPQPSRPRGAVGYGSIHKAIKRLVDKAGTRLPHDEAQAMRRASLHWPCRTFATRAAEAGVTINDIQKQPGQADPKTTARYSRAQIQQRAVAWKRAQQHADITDESDGLKANEHLT